MKKVLITFLLLFGTLQCFAANYTINNVNMNVDVSKNYNIKVKEKIDTYHQTRSYGPQKIILMYKLIKKKDGTVSSSKIRASNVKVAGGRNHRIFATLDRILIKTSTKDKFRGDKSFEISYNYYPDKQLKEENIFYFDILDNAWETIVKNVSFRINMPYSVKKEDIYITSPNIKYKVVGNKIYGKNIKPIYTFENISIRIDVPKGSFNTYDNTKIGFLYAIGGITALLSLAIFMLRARKKASKVNPILTKIPPRNLNSAYIGSIFTEKATERSVYSLIFWLASKGFLKIEENFGSFQLYKLKECNIKDSIPKKIMHELFKSNQRYVPLESVVENVTFQFLCRSLIEELNAFNKKLFQRTKKEFFSSLIYLAIIAGLSMILLFILGGYNFSLICDSLFIKLIFFIFSLAYLFINFEAKLFSVKNIVMSIFPILAFALLSTTILTTAVLENIVLVLYNIIALIGVFICIANLPTKNLVGLKLYGEILGFKKFLESASEDEIRTVLIEKPDYCYEMIPYAFSLGIIDKWCNVIENLNPKMPEWYKGDFNLTVCNLFEVLLDKTNKTK